MSPYEVGFYAAVVLLCIAILVYLRRWKAANERARVTTRRELYADAATTDRQLRLATLQGPAAKGIAHKHTVIPMMERRAAMKARVH
jgi:hypothetical protein